MAKGWIRLNRNIIDSTIWAGKKDYPSAYIDLLLLANYSDKEIMFDGVPVLIKRGQFITSVRALADRWCWSNDKTLKYLRTLESMGLITKESNNKRTLVTIVNYDENEDTPNANSYTDTNANRTQTERKFVTTNNNNNNNNVNKGNKESVFTPPTLAMIKEYCDEQAVRINCEKFYYYHQAKGWKNIEDWKSYVLYWYEQDKANTNANSKKPGVMDFEQSKNDTLIDEMEPLLLQEVNEGMLCS